MKDSSPVSVIAAPFGTNGLRSATTVCIRSLTVFDLLLALEARPSSADAL